MSILVLLSGYFAFTYAQPVLRQYCEGDSFVYSCGLDEVAMVSNALYGRMELGKCIMNDYGQLGCQLDVLPILDARCSGRRHCDVRVSTVYDNIPESARPCSSDFRSYLAASASCVQVVTPGRDCVRDDPPTLTAHRGFLSSFVTRETNCGSYDRPWKIKVEQGRQIRFTLYDFISGTRPAEDFEGNVPKVCEVYAIITDGQERPETICGTRTRQSIVYTSVTSDIQVRVNKHSGGDEREFILQYEAVGCALLTAPPNGWVRQTATRASFGCNHTDVTWTMRCREDEWIGDTQTCASRTSSEIPTAFFNGSQWSAIIIIAAIAVTLGLLIFLAGFLYLKRNKRSTHSPPMQNVSMANPLPPYYAAQSPVPTHAIPDYSSQSEATKYMLTSQNDNVNIMPYPPNDYSRTWQMQRHNRSDVIEQVANQNATPEQQLSQIDGRPITEHIYESPPFERKCNSLDSPRNKSNPMKYQLGSRLPKNVQYYELDPSKTGRKGAIL